MADDFAGRGALSNALPMHVAAAVRHLDTRAKPVQARLLEVSLLHTHERETESQVRANAPKRKPQFDSVQTIAQLPNASLRAFGLTV